MLSNSPARLRAVFILAASAIIIPACAAAPADDTGTAADSSGLASGNKPWDSAAETEWTSFISSIGEARAAGKCITINACINDKTINRYKDDADPDMNIFADCADLPMELRAYFAVKTGRPYRYVSDIIGDLPANADPNAPPDYRYTKNNHPTDWSTLKQSATLQSLMTRVSNVVHTGFYRMAPEIENTDTYPIDIKPGTVHAGTVYYDPNGHILLVFRVEADGTVRMIDSHPDNSLTTTLFDSKLALGSAAQGGGFRNFRSITAQGAGYAPNASLTDFGTTQYGHGAAYYDWVRAQLSGNVAVKPDVKLGQMLDQLCVDVNARVAAVDAATHLATGEMGAIPPNIYGADGDWEDFSTPGRDGRLRASFRGLIQFIQQSTTAVANGDPSFAWDGTEKTLVSKYRSMWSASLASCKITYTNSAATPVTLGLGDIQKRIYDLSFDPYECAEMRWGAYPSATSEFATCNTQDADHMQRFTDETTMRNAIDRPAAGEDTPIGWGPTTPEDIDVGALLGRLANQ